MKSKDHYTRRLEGSLKFYAKYKMDVFIMVYNENIQYLLCFAPILVLWRKIKQWQYMTCALNTSGPIWISQVTFENRKHLNVDQKLTEV